MKLQITVWTPEIQAAFENKLEKTKLIDLITKSQKKGLIIDLVRELQQYILSQCSGTTDSSTKNSTTLDQIMS